MPSTFEIPYIPDLTDQIIKSKLFVTSGGYADVYKCMWNSPSESSPVAVKVFRPRFGQSNRSNLREAIKVWGRLQNDHILPLLGLVHGYGPSPALVSPWMDNGTLMNFLNERHDTLKRCERLRLLQDIALALQYLHAIAVVHGDLTGFSILVDSHRRAFVMDVRSSTMLDHTMEPRRFRPGAIRWTAPELLKDDMKNILPTFKSDVWSFGCNMIHVLSGQRPWSSITNNISAIFHAVKHRPVPLPQDISKQDSYFLRQCFSSRPVDRPSADQILDFVHGESLHCISGMPRTAEATAHNSRNGIPDVMAEFKRRVSDQVPSHLIYIPEMKLISRDELAAILKPEMITDEDISEHEGWSRQFVIESKLTDLLKYAILSHRWGESEPSFRDAKRLAKRKGAGYEKLRQFCKKAEEHGCLLAWSDTCCINKESSSELDEAIRSMYRWYRNAYICIVYLAQTQSLETPGSDEWFLRVWTLQELLAPLRMKFYSDGWAPLTQNENDKDDAALVFTLSRVTKIPPNDLCNFRPGPNRAWEKMTWATGRKTTRIEDIAYSLIGVFDISMTIAYGEGDRAFKRFMAELIQNCKEWQILVWAGGLPGCPTDPGCYYATDEAALEMIKNLQISWWGEGCGDCDFSITKRGVQVRLLMVPASIDQSLEESTFLCGPAGQLEASPLDKLVVRSHFFPPASTTEWAIGIVNYHDHPSNADKGKLKRGQRYICFLFTRSRRPGVDTVRNYWRRKVTEEIMTVSCANDLEQILETVWL